VPEVLPVPFEKVVRLRNRAAEVELDPDGMGEGADPANRAHPNEPAHGLPGPDRLVTFP